MQTFVIGDIHGQYRALLKCLHASQFDYEKDRLIALGDVCDRGPHVKECIDELLKLRHLVYLLGNHDAWALEWAVHGKILKEWLDYGGKETIASYKNKGMPREHIELLVRAPLYFEEQSRLFLHAGFDATKGLRQTPREMLIWDRELLMFAKEKQALCQEEKLGGYEEIFVGHTPDLFASEKIPKKFCNIWAMDTGAGHGQMLTIMNVDTKKFWQERSAKLFL